MKRDVFSPTEEQLARLSVFFKTMGDPTRLRILTALLSVSGVSHDDARNELLRRFPNFSEVEINTFDREFEKLKFRKLLLRVGILRQWYITVPFTRGSAGYALTFYGQGPKEKSVETVCNEVEHIAGRIVSAWNRISRL